MVRLPNVFIKIEEWRFSASSTYAYNIKLFVPVIIKHATYFEIVFSKKFMARFTTIKTSFTEISSCSATYYVY